MGISNLNNNNTTMLYYGKQVVSTASTGLTFNATLEYPLGDPTATFVDGQGTTQWLPSARIDCVYVLDYLTIIASNAGTSAVSWRVDLGSGTPNIVSVLGDLAAATNDTVHLVYPKGVPFKGWLVNADQSTNNYTSTIPTFSATIPVKVSLPLNQGIGNTTIETWTGWHVENRSARSNR